MALKAILFDFDGTLANTAPGIVLTMQESFAQMSLPIPEEEDIRQTIGLPLYDSMKKLGGLDDEQSRRAVEIYRSLFPNCELTHITIFPEVAETLDILDRKGLRMAICTSRGFDSLKSILSNHGLFGHFETSVTNTDHLQAKPAPDMVLTLLDRMHLTPDEAIVVGDTTFDIMMGTAAHCRTVAVTYGNHSRKQLAEAAPTFTVDRFGELADIVASLI